MSLAGTALSSPTTESRQSKGISVSILVIESFASTPLGPKIVFANNVALQETGYEEKSLVGSPLGLIYDRDDLRNLIEKLPIIAARAGFCWMNRNLIRNGGMKETMHWTIRPTKRENGRAQHFTLTFKSIQEVRKSDPTARLDRPSPIEPTQESRIADKTAPDSSNGDLEKALQKTRSESLAMAAGGVAHDFKNALQTIKSNLEIAHSLAGVHSKLSTCLNDANHALDDAEILAHQMLAFTRGDQFKSKIFDITDQVQRASTLCTAGSRVSCQLNLEPQLRLVEGDPNRIYQVLHNLVINACQAMPNGGVLHLTTGNADLDLQNRYLVAAGSYTVVSVRDRGCGIPPDILPQIFENNFSTKIDGSGFGLASCLAIVKAHGGEIRAASKVGVGTEFLVFLPSTGKTVERSELSSTQGNIISSSNNTGIPECISRTDQASITKACRVLVVEDQAPVLKATRGLLQHLGHECFEAMDGESAIRTYRQHLDSAEPIDVVLLDMTLPGGLHGVDVYRELQMMDPKVLVIATSGYFDDGPNDTVAEAGFPASLAKPFSMEALSKTITRLLS